MKIPNDAQLNQQSGVISSLTPSQRKDTRDCVVQITGLSFSCHFKLLYASERRAKIKINNGVFEPEDSKGKTIMVNPTTNLLFILLHRRRQDSTVRFIIQFTGNCISSKTIIQNYII